MSNVLISTFILYIFYPSYLCSILFRCHSLTAVRNVSLAQGRGSLTACPHAALNALNVQMESIVIIKVYR